MIISHAITPISIPGNNFEDISVNVILWKLKAVSALLS